MSERLDHDETLPKMNLSMESGEIIAATPENTTLFTHLGRLAMYDHVFLTFSRDGETHQGTYIFAEFMRETFEGMQSFMLDNGYPCYVNKRDVPDCDIDAFNLVVGKHADTMPDEVPEDWFNT